MSLAFPASPSTGQIYQGWRWSGTSWDPNYAANFVTSFNGRAGIVSLAPADITAATPAPLTGIADGSNAAAGKVGEYLTQTATQSALGNSVWYAIASVALTPGDWEVSGNALVSSASNQLAAVAMGIDTVSPPTHASGISQPGISQLNYLNISAGPVRFNVSSATTVSVYVYGSGVSTGAIAATASINARRVR
jgi:hypothetical protein